MGAAQRELPDGHLGITNIEQHHRLDIVDIVNAERLDLQLDNVQKTTVNALKQ